MLRNAFHVQLDYFNVFYMLFSYLPSSIFLFFLSFTFHLDPFKCSWNAYPFFSAGCILFLVSMCAMCILHYWFMGYSFFVVFFIFRLSSSFCIFVTSLKPEVFSTWIDNVIASNFSVSRIYKRFVAPKAVNWYQLFDSLIKKLNTSISEQRFFFLYLHGWIAVSSLGVFSRDFFTLKTGSVD